MSIRVEAHVRGRLLHRYKRFFADVETTDGPELIVHCPNPGKMTRLLRIGAAVRCSKSERPTRKLRHTLEMIRVGRVCVGVHTLSANQLADSALRSNSVPTLKGYSEIFREVRVGDGTRLDFFLSGSRLDPRPVFLEVKSVTLTQGRGARFHDSVTTRGRRHVETLEKLIQSGARCNLLFVVQRGDCDRVTTADDIDPEYGRALRKAVGSGVEMVAVRARVGPSAIHLQDKLPVLL